MKFKSKLALSTAVLFAALNVQALDVAALVVASGTGTLMTAGGSLVYVTAKSSGTSNTFVDAVDQGFEAISITLRRDVVVNAQPEAIACSAHPNCVVADYPALSDAIYSAQVAAQEQGYIFEESSLVNLIALFDAQ